MDPIIAHKAGSLCLMFLLSMVACFLPIKLRKCLNNSSLSERFTKGILSGSLCFGAGVLMATVFLHILKETREKFNLLMEEGIMAESEYPFTELVLCCGFFFIYFVEEIVHSCVNRRNDREEEETFGECHLRRTSSITLQKLQCARNDCKKTEETCPSRMSKEQCKYEYENADFVQNFTQNNFKINTNGLIPEGKNSNKINNNKYILSHENKESYKVSLTRSILVIVALSLHGAFEGLSLGLEDDIRSVWLLFAALTAHKIFIGFSIGMEMQEIGVDKLVFSIHILIFSLASPIGGIIGALLKGSVGEENDVGEVVIAALQGISGGTILYVTFCEVLERERNKPKGRFIKLFSLMAGFFVMAGLEAFGEEHHHHHHRDDGHHNHEDHLLHEGHHSFHHDLKDAIKI